MKCIINYKLYIKEINILNADEFNKINGTNEPEFNLNKYFLYLKVKLD